MNPNHHIVELTAENIKRLRAVHITPTGALVTIAGRNGQGKSSVLDSICYALGGKDAVDAIPVRRGERYGKIILTLDDGTMIKRTLREDGATELIIRDRKGHLVTGPQQFLDRLTGKAVFDPLSFDRMDARRRLEFVQQLVGLDFTEHDDDAAKLFAERRDVKRDAERVRVEAEAMPLHPDARTAVDLGPLETAMADANAVNDEASKLVSAALGVEHEAENHRVFLGELQRQREQVAHQLATLDARIVAGRNVVKAREDAATQAREAANRAPRTDPADVATKLEAARAHNRRVAENVARGRKAQDARNLSAKAEELTAALEHLAKDKETKLAAAKFPVPGMSFTKDGVTIDGLPYEQAAASVRLRSSVLMGAATNPGLRVMIVREGSLLDVDARTLLAQLAQEHNLQVWLEVVGKDTAPAIIIEDGAVQPPEDSK
jgi:energy-coupling factor transporter ATP-binding protein EcfA2